MRRLAALVVVATLLSGCGIGVSAESSSHAIDPRSVPFGLLEPATPVTAPPTGRQDITIYLVGQNRLVTVDRTVPSATLRSTLAELAQGATNAEASEGLDSPISGAAPFSVRAVAGGTATVELARSFTNLGGEDQIFAAAQLVFTVTLLPRITGVLVRIGGQATELPAADGSLKKGPLTRADYASLAPLGGGRQPGRCPGPSVMDS